MRILFFSSIFPQPYDPTRGVYCFHLCRALAKCHEVTVISPCSWLTHIAGQGGRGDSREENCSHFAGGVTYPCYYYPPKVLRSTYAWFMWHSVRATLKKCFSSYHPECIVSYWLHPDGAVAIRAARLFGVPAVVMVGGSDALLLTQSRGRRRRIVKVLEEADGVAAVGNHLRDKLIELGACQDKVYTVERGVDSHLFSPGDQALARQRLGISPASRVLLYVGNLVPLKGLDILLEACTMLRQRNLDFRLYLVGKGKLRNSLEDDSRARQLSQQVLFVGSLPHDRLPDWYRAADLTVLPSLSEGVPNVLRESLACGTPFVGTCVGGIPELATDASRQLVPPGNAPALADRIFQAVCHDQLPPEPGKPLLNWDDSAQALERVLAAVIARSKTHIKLPKERASVQCA